MIGQPQGWRVSEIGVVAGYESKANRNPFTESKIEVGDTESTTGTHGCAWITEKAWAGERNGQRRAGLHPHQPQANPSNQLRPPSVGATVGRPVPMP